MRVLSSAAGLNLLKSLCLIAGAFLFLGLSGCAQNPVSGKQDFVMLSEDSEIAIGRENHPKILKQYRRYNNEAIQRYVQSVGERLAKVSHRSHLTFRFTVLDSPVVNAFALPGGYIYITRGLMAYLNSEAELAAVLGHEIGHVTARHGVRQQSAAQATGLAYGLGAIFFPELRSAGSQNAFNTLSGALLSGYGREHELESDGLGAEYLAKAGYDSKAMIEVIRVLKAQEVFAAEQAKKQGRQPQSYHGLFASHPDNDTRLQQVVGAADQFSLNRQGNRSVENYLNHIDGMTFGDSKEQGIRREHHFYHAEMNFAVDFPVAWQIMNQPDRLQAIAPNGTAFVEMRVADINRKISPRDFIFQRLKVERLIAGQRLRNHGLEGYTGLLEQQGKQARISVIYLGDKAFVFFSTVKDQQQFNRVDGSFINVAKSLRRLSKAEKALAEAYHLKVVQVRRGDSYTRWAKRSPITNSALEQLKLLNGDYPAGQLKVGQRVKRVE